MMKIKKDISNRRFGRLIAMYFLYKKRGHAYWFCRCDCGKETITTLNKLEDKHTRSCGCLNKEKLLQSSITHNMCYSKFYNIWRGIKTRCNNPNSKSYKDYGKRGIKNEWKSFEKFKKDVYPSYLEHIKKFGEDNTFIERNDNNGNYNKKNCSFKTRLEQNNNKRNNHLITFKGKTQTVSQWAEELNIKRNNLYTRIFMYKWPIEKSFFTPIQKRNKYVE